MVVHLKASYINKSYFETLISELDETTGSISSTSLFSYRKKLKPREK